MQRGISIMRLSHHLSIFALLLSIILSVHSAEITIECRSRHNTCFVRADITEYNTTIKRKVTDTAACKILHFKDRSVNYLPNNIAQCFPGLTELKVIQASLKKIEKTNFVGLEQLTEIDFEANEISTLPTDVFELLVNLNKINLNRNKITAIPSTIFSNNLKLTYISLSHNEIKEIDDRTFRNLANLKNLFLSNNNIASLHCGTFDDCTELTNFDIPNNALSYISPNIFNNNKKLKISIDNFKNNKCTEDNKERISANLDNLQSLSGLADFLSEVCQSPDYNAILKIIRMKDSQCGQFSVSSNAIETSTKSTPKEAEINITKSDDGSCSCSNENRAISTISTITKSTDFYNVSCKFEDFEYRVGGLLYGNFFACKVNGQKVLSCGKTLKDVNEAPIRQSVDGLMFDNSYYVHYPEKIFDKFRNLKYLSISNSGFGNFEENFCELSNAFEFVLVTESFIGENIIIGNCLSLKHLKIENSGIKEIRAEIPVKSLTDLVLKNNKIEKISKEFLSKFEDLKNLQMSGNEIEHLDGSTFAGNKALAILNLSNNPIKTIGDEIFRINMKLIYYDFRHLACTSETEAKSNLAGEESSLNNLKETLVKYCKK